MSTYFCSFFTDGTDFVLSTYTLQFTSEQVESCFEVTVTDDNLVEGNETIRLHLTTPGQTPLVTMVTIIDDDSAEISFNPLTYQTNESDGGVTLMVAIDGEVATSLEYSITFTPMTADSNDFNSEDVTRSLPLQSSRDNVFLEVFDDSVPEGREMFAARLVVPLASAEKGVCVVCVCVCMRACVCVHVRVRVYLFGCGFLVICIYFLYVYVHVCLLFVSMMLTLPVICTSLLIGLILSLTANTAVIFIEDDDIITVTFTSDKFSVGEGDGVAMVTVQSDIAAASDLTLGLSALLSSTATGERI